MAVDTHNVLCYPFQDKITHKFYYPYKDVIDNYKQMKMKAVAEANLAKATEAAAKSQQATWIWYGFLAVGSILLWTYAYTILGARW